MHYYCHLKSFAPGIALGKQVEQGALLGLLGKEGDSGGWSHLHYGIFARQPSGKLGTEEGYAYLVEAYRRAHNPMVLAVARPHRLISAGDSVVLDGARSWSQEGARSYRWTFGDGTTAEGAQVTRRTTGPASTARCPGQSDGAEREL
jgi:murein DD-endopeptidase MepM/ murein hydrolase activator NlpD